MFLCTLFLASCASSGVVSEESADGKLSPLSSEDIQNVFDENQALIFSIYKRALGDNPSLGGEMVFDITAIYNKPNKCQVRKAGGGLELVAEKICTVIKDLDFGPAANKTFSYPINFLPEEHQSKSLDASSNDDCLVDSCEVGFVKLEFDLSETGKAINIKVIESNLGEEFQKVAIEQAKEFQFKPKLVNGKPARQNNLQYTMEFKPEQE